MHTTHPCIMLGSYVWNQDEMPDDEFDIRLAGLRAAMAQNNWAAVLVYGDAREHQALAWYTNFIPRMRWAMALIPAKGEPRVLVSVTARDMPAMRTMTFVKEVYSGWEWQWFDGFIEKLGGPGTLGCPGTLAVIGSQAMTPVLYGQIGRSVAGKFDLVEADDILLAARTVHRPRETAMIRIAAAIVEDAGQKFLAAWSDGKDIESAALAAEQAARGRAAQDARTLVSRDFGQTFEPYRARFDDYPETCIAYIAVKYQGYWADTFVTATTRSRQVDHLAKAALEAVLQSFAPGVRPDVLIERARNALAPLTLHPALLGSLGHRIGLSANEGGDIIEGGAAVQAGCAYALRVGACEPTAGGAIASAVVHLHKTGRLEVLARNREP